MELDTTYKEKRGISRKIGVKRLVIGTACILAIGILCAIIVSKVNSQGKQGIMQQRTAKVSRGNLSITVTGSGPVASSNKSELTSSVSGKVTKVYFKEGDNVKAGDLMFELDDSEARMNIEKIKNNIEQTRLSANSNAKSLSNLEVKAPLSGQITDIAPIKAGDELQKGANLFTITDTSKLKLNVSFGESVINEMKKGQQVTVNIQDIMQSVNGIVSYIGNNPSTTSSGTKVYDAEIVISNPGSLKEGMSASVEVSTKNGSLMSTNAGSLEYINSQSIKSISGGTVESINIKKNQYVNEGQILIKLQNDELAISSQTNELKIQELDSQLESAEKQLAEYKIYSPLDGVIVSQDIKTGTTIKPADILASILDPGHMEFSISIDELDIAKIKIGQKTSITVDALPETSNKPLSGEVTKIAIEGTSSNGVTTYPVTIKINETENLRVGMNADGEIIISEKEDVLVVPLEAVQKMRNRSFVMVKSDGENVNPGRNGAKDGNIGSSADPDRGNSQNASRRNISANTGGNTGGYASVPGNMAGLGQRNNSQYYSNAMPKPVETGINNDEYIEILSGLQEGDEIILPPLSSQSITTQNQGAFGPMGGGFGGMGGIQRNSGNAQRNNASQGGNNSERRNNN